MVLLVLGCDRIWGVVMKNVELVTGANYVNYCCCWDTTVLDAKLCGA